MTVPTLKTHYDIIVIGSGAAGSVMTYELADKGLSVLLIEKGRRHNPSDFVHDELEMYARLYKYGGLQTTTDNDTTIAQGCAVGGSTVINNAIWLRANLDKVLPEWKAFGADIPKQNLVEAYEWLETKLNVTDVDPRMANKGSQIFLDACQRKNIKASLLKNNRKACIGCGWCNYGCRYNRKTSMLVTFIPWAEAKGALVLDDIPDTRIVVQNSTATGVTFTYQGGQRTVKAGKIVVSAGAIGSSQVLLESNINPGGNVGKGLHVLGGFFASAEMQEPVNGYDGIGLTCVAEVSDDYVIETWFAPPGIFALTMGGWFAEHHRRMLKYPHYIMAGVMVGTEPRGRVRMKKGRALIDLKFSKDEINKLKTGFKALALIFFEAGALQVIPSTFKDMAFDSKDDLVRLDQLIRKADDFTLGSAHPQGGNRMSDDPKNSVTNSRFEVHGYQNLMVVDSSVFPTNIRANCQATIMAMSKYASTLV